MESTVGRRGRFGLHLRHYLEMVAVMVVGMLTLLPLADAAAAAAGVSWAASPEVEAMVMATAMAVPMAGWMILRGHCAAAAFEMSLAMYGGFVAFFPLLWSGMIDRGALLGLGHVAMLLLMALVMVRRPHPHHQPA